MPRCRALATCRRFFAANPFAVGLTVVPAHPSVHFATARFFTSLHEPQSVSSSTLQKPASSNQPASSARPSSSSSPGTSTSFLTDRKLERSNHRWTSNANQRNSASTKASSTSGATASPSIPRVPLLQRRMQGTNKIAVLHAPDTAIVTLDISITIPVSGNPPPSSSSPDHTKTGASATTFRKSMAREEQDAAVKTLERMRMLFAPPRPNGQAGRRTTREGILASCPSIRVFGNSAALAAAATELARPLNDLVAPGSAPGVTFSSLHTDDGNASTYQEMNEELPNGLFWKCACVLVVNDTVEVQVLYNQPTITAIAPPGVPYVGLPLVCGSLTLSFATGSNVCYEWCLAPEKGSVDTPLRVLSTASAFIPTEDLLGQHLILRLSLNSAAGLWTELRLPAAVQALPLPVPRWSETQTPASAPDFRVVTYNILYDDFCTSKSSKAKIYPFATDDILDLENRKVRIVQELLAYHADLICLQECGRDVFQTYLLPVLRAAGYDGVYVNKNGSVKEGCGFLFRVPRYSLLHMDSIPLNYMILSAQHPDLTKRVDACPELKEALSAVTTVGARLVLRDSLTAQEIVVGNTHLFFHANACHIRALQTYVLLHWLHKATVEGRLDATGSVLSPARPMLLCGDFNCTHPTAAYRLLTTGQVEASHRSWEKGKLFWWGCSRLLGYDAERLGELLGEDTVLPQATIARKDFKRVKESPAVAGAPPVAEEDREEAQGANIKPIRGDDHVVTEIFREQLYGPPVRLQDAYQRTDPSMPWTNYTLTFREVIDYVFYAEESIEVLRTIPIPPESELAENFALPNKQYPSDHVALVADLRLK